MSPHDSPRADAVPPPRTFRGRALPRPDEDVDDQGLAFDLRTMLDRRALLSGLGLGLAGLGLAACGDAGTATASTSASALTEIPDETAGPYPGDGSNGANVLTQSGVVRSDLRSSFGTSTTTAPGVPMTLTLDVVDMVDDDAPMEGAAVYVWHCDRDGEYSLYADGLEDENFLRGVQVADAAGSVTFTSIVPAAYSGRWPHVHFEVYPDVASITDATNAVATSQLALPEATADLVYATAGYEASVANLANVTLGSDNVFSDDSAATQLPTVTGDVASGFTLTLRVGVDTSTVPTAGSAPTGGGPGDRPTSA
ncbi:dioxygenase family protein [Kineococcus rubinsiae]|uniref:dioxygenase family protein n=1 Tax=Kineococcus rubinsiae TaxID=2609562 RepID=UPI00143056EC|nr:3,4-dioxygenase subunit beta [Kineococcus rubinsiae]NIZ93335.1 3,4-dioxygenase subunit beta [Kineococcus rubinsiae]